jgi:hypothetical protein
MNLRKVNVVSPTMEERGVPEKTYISLAYPPYKPVQVPDMEMRIPKKAKVSCAVPLSYKPVPYSYNGEMAEYLRQPHIFVPATFAVTAHHKVRPAIKNHEDRHRCCKYNEMNLEAKWQDGSVAATQFIEMSDSHTMHGPIPQYWPMESDQSRMLKLSYLDEINRRWRAEYGDMYETW